MTCKPTLIATCLLLATSSIAMAHKPLFAPIDYRGNDYASAIQNSLPMPYRARYNRPRYTTGKLLHMIEPTSQEAMAWHIHKHRGTYQRHEGKVVFKYYYPKPWEALPIGPRKAAPADSTDRYRDEDGAEALQPGTEAEDLAIPPRAPQLDAAP